MSSTIDLGSMFQAQGPKPGRSSKRIPVTAFTQRVVVPVLPRDASYDLQIAFGVYLMLCGTSASTSLDEWKKYIATYSAYIVPSVAQRLPQEVYTLHPIGTEKAQQIIAAYGGFKTYLEALDGGADADHKEALLRGLQVEGLPRPPSQGPWEEVYSQGHPKVIACHYAIVLFLMSKRVEADNHSPITEARPRALKGKAHITEVMPFLDGKLRLSDVSHLALNSAWSESAALRGACVLEFCRFAEIETDITQDLIYTSMHLMKFGAMAHAKITYAFLKAYPWAGEIPALMNAISIYKDSVLASSKHPEEIRPYLKLIYGDKLSIFPRNELDVLVACAVEVEKETNPTLADFYVNDQYGPIVESFKEEMEKRGEIRRRLIDSQLSKLQGFADEAEEDEEYEEVLKEE